MFRLASVEARTRTTGSYWRVRPSLANCVGDGHTAREVLPACPRLMRDLRMRIVYLSLAVRQSSASVRQDLEREPSMHTELTD
jgi:hypothetical protein